jgi:hypothetical protein
MDSNVFLGYYKGTYGTIFIGDTNLNEMTPNGLVVVGASGSRSDGIALVPEVEYLAYDCNYDWTWAPIGSLNASDTATPYAGRIVSGENYLFGLSIGNPRKLTIPSISPDLIYLDSNYEVLQRQPKKSCPDPQVANLNSSVNALSSALNFYAGLISNCSRDKYFLGEDYSKANATILVLETKLNQTTEALNNQTAINQNLTSVIGVKTQRISELEALNGNLTAENTQFKIQVANLTAIIADLMNRCHFEHYKSPTTTKLPTTTTKKITTTQKTTTTKKTTTLPPRRNRGRGYYRY